MASNLNLEVVTPQRLVFKNEIRSLVVPAAEGYLGILTNHAPIIVGLMPGVVKYCQEGNDCHLAITGGFMEVANNQATILASAAERPEEIDKARAQAAKERAEQRLKEKPPGLDVARAEFALKRAVIRLKVAEYAR